MPGSSRGRGGVRSGGAGGPTFARPTFLHVPEGRVAEAVGAQRVALAPGPGRPQHQLKVVQRAAELLVQLDGAVLGEAVGLVAVGAVEPAGLGLQGVRIRSDGEKPAGRAAEATRWHS